MVDVPLITPVPWCLFVCLSFVKVQHELQTKRFLNQIAQLQWRGTVARGEERVCF